MTQSDAIDQLAVAMAKSQALLEPAHFDKVNPHYKSKFASLSSVMKAAKIYAANGISYTQLPVFLEADAQGRGGFVLQLVIMHTSGQWVASVYPLPDPTTVNPQQLGSAITYAKRYQLSAAFAISADDDDDGNAAVEKNIKAAPKITDDQVVTLGILADEVGVESMQAFCQYLGVDKLNHLPAYRYPEAITALEKKRAKADKKLEDTDVDAGG